MEDLAIQSASLAMVDLNSSDAQLKLRSQFLSSTDSAPSAPAAPESFYATHITSSSVKLRVTVYGNSSYSLKTAHVEFSMGGTCMSG